MPKFTGKYEETFTLDVPLEAAKQHFADLDRIVAAYGGLEHSEKLDDRTLRFRLEPRTALGNTFQGKYDCKYELQGDDLVWRTVNAGANIETEGRAKFTKVGDSRTKVFYKEAMTCDIPINRLLAKAIKPIVDKSVADGIKDYIAKMRSSLKK